MDLDDLMIPPIAVVREKLVRNERERTLLQRLYRLSIKAAEERVEHERVFGKAGAPRPQEAVPC